MSHTIKCSYLALAHWTKAGLLPTGETVYYSASKAPRPVVVPSWHHQTVHEVQRELGAVYIGAYLDGTLTFATLLGLAEGRACELLERVYAWLAAEEHFSQELADMVEAERLSHFVDVAAG